MTASLESLRSAYIQGDLEAEEFEERLDDLLAADPEALDKPGTLDLKWGPGVVIPYDPRDGIPTYDPALDARVKVAASFEPRLDCEEGEHEWSWGDAIAMGISDTEVCRWCGVHRF